MQIGMKNSAKFEEKFLSSRLFLAKNYRSCTSSDGFL
ncbi:Protein of unknown function [Pyronema omphalodes CBS 100304]|uniref:Uncharacterized protein n=1 Tax=Pyronema omphalodes (strain CBS 100304) TaxID=1076935 RepID=U4LDH9_PYROM|nr:Protein of unknown function [Pyronema omphalodes CBS 100304]